MIHWDIERDELSFNPAHRRGDYDAPMARHFALLKAYNAVMRVMDARKILPGRTGVLYSDASGRPRALWAFEDMGLSLPQGMSARDVLIGTGAPISEYLHATRHHVYVIGPAA